MKTRHGFGGIYCIMSNASPSYYKKTRVGASAIRRTPRRFGLERLEQRDCPALMISIAPPNIPIFEGDAAVFTVRLSEPSSQPERVGITVAAGTATLGKDFVFNNNTQLLFAPGQTTQTFFVRTFTDRLAEGAETFVVTARSLNRPNVQAVKTATMYDLILTTVRADNVRVVEGNNGTTAAVFTVRLEGRPMLPVTVSYATADVTALAGSDYVAASGVLSFAPGESVKTVSVQINGDLEAETDETFRLNLTNPSRGTTIATPSLTGTIVNDESDQPGFQITVEYVTSFYGEVPIRVRNATQAAVNRWQQVITGDIPGFLEVSTGNFVDDFRMRVQMGLLGGEPNSPGGALANAMPLQYRTTGSQLPWLGETGIDPADVTSSQLVAILTHEIGHALGFASSNPNFTRWVSGFTWTGPNALREYRTLAGTSVTSVPLESGGGGGTAGAHWSDSVFRTELMTGYVEPAGVAMPLSKVTVGAFADLGYTVNYAAADAFVLTAAIQSPQLTARGGPLAAPGTTIGSQPQSSGPPRPVAPPPVTSPSAPKMDFPTVIVPKTNLSLKAVVSTPRTIGPSSSAAGRSIAFALLSRKW